MATLSKPEIKITHPEALRRKKSWVRELRMMYTNAHKFRAGISDCELEQLGIKLLPLDLQQPSRNESLFYKPVLEDENLCTPLDTYYCGDLYTSEEKVTESGRGMLCSLKNLESFLQLLGDNSNHTEWSW